MSAPSQPNASQPTSASSSAVSADQSHSSVVPCTEGHFINKAHELARLRVPSAEMRRKLLNENKGCQNPLPEEKIYLHINAAVDSHKAKKRNVKILAKQQHEPNVSASAPVAPASKTGAPIPTHTPADRLELWKKIETFLVENFHDPDVTATKIIYATAASHRISNYAPAWAIAIAPPGSMKTAALNALDGLPGVHLIDEVTANTFISGKSDEPGQTRTIPASLLHRIGNDGIIIVADFSTVLEMDEKARGKIL